MPTLDGRTVDKASIVIEGVDIKDHPDYSDAFIASAKFKDGSELSEKQLTLLNDLAGILINEMAHESLF